MWKFNKIQKLNWPVIRAHTCSLAISVSFNSIWRIPRDAFRYGGISYGIVLTAALILIGLPVTLLQLAIGQLSQQDTVGIWRAVPFFRGVGYIRILVSCIAASYTMIYVALSTEYFLYTSVNSIPFPDCVELIIAGVEYVEVSMNSSECLYTTFLSSVSTKPEYFLAIGLISLVLWILSPFIFFSVVKIMKRIFYVVTPLIIIIGIVIVSGIGDASLLEQLVPDDWMDFSEPYIWHAAVVQALWSCQIAGGYLITAGDAVYSSTNIERTSLIIVGMNVISCWMSLMFWYAVSGSAPKDTSVVAVLVQTYQVAAEEQLATAWPLMVFFIIMLSGLISMLTLLYPIYTRLRQMFGLRWRVSACVTSIVAAGISLGFLVGQQAVLTIMEEIVTPLLITMATVLEILVFGFGYGWKTLIDDIEFLISAELPRNWVRGWWMAAGVIVPITAWWACDIYIQDSSWDEPSYEAITLSATAFLGLSVILLCGVVAVARQEQFDLCEKLKASFKSSRHWGPRDPITHYYWVASREDHGVNYPRSRYSRRELGQLSNRSSFLTVSETVSNTLYFEEKKRSNSDDWIYTVSRKQLHKHLIKNKRRTKSLDINIRRNKKRLTINEISTVVYKNENNINVPFFTPINS